MALCGTQAVFRQADVEWVFDVVMAGAAALLVNHDHQ